MFGYLLLSVNVIFYESPDEYIYIYDKELLIKFMLECFLLFNSSVFRYDQEFTEDIQG